MYLFNSIIDAGYNALKSISKPYVVREDSTDRLETCWILGKQMKRDAARELSSNSLCMVYRTGFSLKDYTFITDRGYGCTIRAYQTLMARALMRHYLVTRDREGIQKILRYFTDQKHQDLTPFDFSFQRIFKEIATRYNLRNIQYFQMEKVAAAIEQIHKHDHHKDSLCKAQTCIKSYNANAVDFTELLQVFGYQPCQCIPKNYYCPDICHRKTAFKKKQLILMVSGIFDKSESKEFYTKLFLRKEIIGGVTGVDRDQKSFYTMGYDCKKDRMVILDPHIVQPATNIHNYRKHYKTFFPEDFKCVNYNEISNSYGVGFYIQDVRQLVLLRNLINQKSKKPIFHDISLKGYGSEPQHQAGMRVMSSVINQSLLVTRTLSLQVTIQPEDQFQVLEMVVSPKSKEWDFDSIRKKSMNGK